MLKRLWICLIVTALAMVSGASWNAARALPTVGEVAMKAGDNFVTYPQLEGLANEAVQKKINDDIVLSGKVTDYILTFTTLGQSPWGLQVTYQSYLNDAVFSVVLSAKGKQPGGRNGHSYAAMTYDLLTGERVGLDMLFADAEQAVSAMEEIAETTLGLEMSEYMEANQLCPLPRDAFFLNGDGITFYYPSDQFSYVSGRAGSCQFYYEELSALLRKDAEGLPSRMGLRLKPYSAKECRDKIAADVSAGRLPHVPVALGQPMTEIVDAYGLTRTPDAFPGGRYFVLEDPAFRSVLLISDSMEAGYERSVVKGIQAKRGSLYGLDIGTAARAAIHEILGDPEETIVFTENMAYDYNLPTGHSDIYRFGGNELRLHTDESGILRCVQLGK